MFILAVLLHVIKNYVRNALSPNPNNKLEIFHGDIEIQAECLSGALRTAQESFWCVINTDKELFLRSGSVDRKLRMYVGGTGSDSQFMSRYFTGVLLCRMNRNPLECSAVLKHKRQR